MNGDEVHVVCDKSIEVREELKDGVSLAILIVVVSNSSVLCIFDL